MELFLAVFAQMIDFYYSSFDRIVINGYLSHFYNPGNIVFLFKKILGFEKITAKRNLMIWKPLQAGLHG